MSGSKLTFALALAAVIAAATPASAGPNGTDYLNYLQAGKRTQSTLQSAPVRAPFKGPSHRYQGSKQYH